MIEDGRFIHPPALKAPGYLANHAAQVFNRIVDAALREHGLSMALLAPLLILEKQGALLQRDLVNALGVGQPALVATLVKLEVAGLIVRRTDEKDRRASRLTLTEAGRAAAATGEAILWNTNTMATSGMTESAKGKLVGLLEQVIATMKEQETKHHE